MKSNELVNKKTLEHGATIAGVAAGAAGAVAVAGAATATTGIAGGALAAMGLTLTAATPVGWIIGGGLVGAAALKYGSKLISKKGELSGVTNTMDNVLQERQAQRLTKIGLSLNATEQTTAIELLHKALTDGIIDQNIFNDFKLNVETGTNTLIEISDMLELPIPKETNSINEVILLMRSGISMAAADGTVDSSEIDAIFKYISTDIPISKEDFEYLFNLEHEINKDKVMNQLLFFQISSSFYETPTIFKKILTMLETIGKADGDFDEYEKHLYHVAQDIFSMAEQADIYSNNSQNITTYVKDEINILLPTEKTLEAYFKKSTTAIDSFAKGLDLKDIIAIHDSTYFGKSDEGFVVTPYGVIDHENGLLLYDWITSIEVSNNDIVILNTEYPTPFIISKLMNPESFASYLKQFIRNSDGIKLCTVEKPVQISTEDKAAQRVQKMAQGMVSVEEKVSKMAGLASFAMKSAKRDISKAVDNSEAIDDVKEKVGGFFSKMKNKAKELVEEHSTNEKHQIQELSTNKVWHLAKNSEQLGLHSINDINEKFSKKSLHEDSLMVWKDGMAEWLPATEIEEINSIIEKYKVAIPPPLPSSPPPLPS